MRTAGPDRASRGRRSLPAAPAAAGGSIICYKPVGETLSPRPSRASTGVAGAPGLCRNAGGYPTSPKGARSLRLVRMSSNRGGVCPRRSGGDQGCCRPHATARGAGCPAARSACRRRRRCAAGRSSGLSTLPRREGQNANAADRREDWTRRDSGSESPAMQHGKAGRVA